MKNSRIANVVFAFAGILAATGSLIQVDPILKPSYDVFGPSKVEAGSLVLLSVQGKDVKWQIFPEVPFQTYGENHEFLATTFKAPGDYLVVAAFLDKGGKIHLEKQLILSWTSGADSRKPDPEPEPEIPTENTKFAEVAQQVQEICKDLDRETASALATNFLSVAENINLGKYETVKEILSETGKLNRTVIAISPVTTKIQLIVTQKRFSQELVTMEDFQDLWTQIAKGLLTL